MLFKIRNLTKLYENRTILEIPELFFEKGRIYALLGPNGSGKTTLLEILGLLSPPTTGLITYGDRLIDFDSNHLFALRREIIMVHQNPILFSTTVYKNLEFGLNIRGVPMENRANRIEEALDLVGMGPFVHAEAHRLSGGETQRVAIARALVCSPKVMFFDEPTSNVDVENQTAIERIIRDINQQKGISVVFTTHNIVQASRLAEEVISLYDGRLVPSLFENIFTGKMIEGRNGSMECLIHDRVSLPVGTEKRGEVRLCIDPMKIRIFSEKGDSPGETTIKGRLVQLTDEKDFIRAVVDIGIPLNILMPKETFDASVSIGTEVEVSCPPSAVHIF